jgi:hypothetical protein
VEFFNEKSQLEKARTLSKFGSVSVKKPGLETFYRIAYHVAKRMRKNPKTLESTW